LWRRIKITEAINISNNRINKYLTFKCIIFKANKIKTLKGNIKIEEINYEFNQPNAVRKIDMFVIINYTSR